MSGWQPTSYLRFARERTQPSVDLVSRVDLRDPERILDIGCGPGNSTAVLRSRWPGAEITGIDNSPEMIDKVLDLPRSVTV
jgi:trans-aconitate 2-methyltransferase